MDERGTLTVPKKSNILKDFKGPNPDKELLTWTFAALLCLSFVAFGMTLQIADHRIHNMRDLSGMRRMQNKHRGVSSRLRNSLPKQV